MCGQDCVRVVGRGGVIDGWTFCVPPFVSGFTLLWCEGGVEFPEAREKYVRVVRDSDGVTVAKW